MISKPGVQTDPTCTQIPGSCGWGSPCGWNVEDSHGRKVRQEKASWLENWDYVFSSCWQLCRNHLHVWWWVVPEAVGSCPCSAGPGQPPWLQPGAEAGLLDFTQTTLRVLTWRAQSPDWLCWWFSVGIRWCVGFWLCPCCWHSWAGKKMSFSLTGTKTRSCSSTYCLQTTRCESRMAGYWIPSLLCVMGRCDIVCDLYLWKIC